MKLFYESYIKFRNFIGYFFMVILILIILTGGKITIEIGLIDWVIKLIP